MGGDYRFLDDQWIRDEVTMAGEMYRRDWPIMTPEGTELYNQLIEAFPEEENNGEVRTSPLESIGLNKGGLRSAYSNDTLSWYGYGSIPEATRKKYGVGEVPQHSDGLRSWYGKKYDLVTKEKMLKVATPFTDTIPMPKNMLKGKAAFLGLLYREDGTMSRDVDYYVMACQYAELAYFCGKHDLRHNVSAKEYREDINKFCFSVVYNIDTLQPTEFKVYRFFVYGS